MIKYTLELSRNNRRVGKIRSAAEGGVRASLLAYAIHNLMVESKLKVPFCMTLVCFFVAYARDEWISAQIGSVPWHDRDRHLDYGAHVEVFEIVLSSKRGKKDSLGVFKLGSLAADCIWAELRGSLNGGSGDEDGESSLEDVDDEDDEEQKHQQQGKRHADAYSRISGRRMFQNA